MTRERLVWLLCVLMLAAVAWWLSANTEWVEVDSPRAARGEARDNPVYAFEQTLRRLGMTAVHREALDPLPPEGARLVVLSSDWQVMPGAAEQLHRWVLRGGHLVLTLDADGFNPAMAPWLPVEAVEVKPPQQARPAGVFTSTTTVTPGPATLKSTPPMWGHTEAVRGCAWFFPDRVLRTRPGHEAAWSLELIDGTPATQAIVAQQNKALQALQGAAAKPAVRVLRAPLGQGSVTVLNGLSQNFYNGSSLNCDNPLLLAAAVQAEPGATAWIYLNEKREPLLPWLWHQGWIAIVGGLLALAAALWRAAVRFGPRLAPAPRLRRSIAEQVRGLGAYLHRHGPDALLAAQQRALHEAAGKTLPRYARLGLPERAQAIAAATGLAASDLAAAFSARFCTRKELPQHLQLLETARRRLHKTPDERHSP